MSQIKTVQRALALVASKQYFNKIASSKNGVSRRKSSRRASKKKSAFKLSQFRLIATFTVAIIFIWGIYSLAKVDPNKNNQPNYTDNTSSASSTAQKSSPTERTQTINGYTFYAKLKDFSIEVPKGTNYSNKTDTFNSVIYLIQTGSFKTAARAERQLVALKLLGLEPTVKDHINSNGNRWFRVTVGPFNSRSKMASTRNTIISNGIDASVMKRKL